MPGQKPIKALPTGYREASFISINKPGMLVWLNLMSLIPLVISGMLVFGALLVYHEELGAPLVFNDALPDDLPTWGGLLLVLLVLPLHELMHGLAIQYFGHKPRYGFKLVVMFATSDGAYFRRGEFIRIALAPLAAISLLGAVIMLFVPQGVGYWVGWAVCLNAAGAIGDLWMTAAVLRYHPATLIRDEADSMRIFVRL